MTTTLKKARSMCRAFWWKGDLYILLGWDKDGWHYVMDADTLHEGWTQVECLYSTCQVTPHLVFPV